MRYTDEPTEDDQQRHRRRTVITLIKQHTDVEQWDIVFEDECAHFPLFQHAKRPVTQRIRDLFDIIVSLLKKLM